jgi:hypothetical protein
MISFVVRMHGYVESQMQLFKRALLFVSILLLFPTVLLVEASPLITMDRIAQRIVSDVLPEKSKGFSQLQIEKITYEDGKVQVIGITDLPDGTQLSVEFDVVGRPETATYIGVRTEVKVANKQFTALFIPPRRPEFTKGLYVVEVVCAPRSQSEGVTKLLGKNGEQLRGPTTRKMSSDVLTLMRKDGEPFNEKAVQDFFDFNIMQISQKVRLKLQIPSYAMVRADAYTADAPERAFAEFMRAWQRKDWRSMEKFVQKTWRHNQKDPREMLRAWYGFKDLLGVEIMHKSAVQDFFSVSPLHNLIPVHGVIVEITATISYAVGPNIETKTVTARMIREAAPYTPSPKGQWGVNPVSIL